MPLQRDALRAGTNVESCASGAAGRTGMGQRSLGQRSLGQRSLGQRNGGKGMGTGTLFVFILCLHSFAQSVSAIGVQIQVGQDAAVAADVRRRIPAPCACVPAASAPQRVRPLSFELCPLSFTPVRGRGACPLAEMETSLEPAWQTNGGRRMGTNDPVFNGLFVCPHSSAKTPANLVGTDVRRFRIPERRIAGPTFLRGSQRADGRRPGYRRRPRRRVRAASRRPYRLGARRHKC